MQKFGDNLIDVGLEGYDGFLKNDIFRDVTEITNFINGKPSASSKKTVASKISDILDKLLNDISTSEKRMQDSILLACIIIKSGVKIDSIIKDKLIGYLKESDKAPKFLEFVYEMHYLIEKLSNYDNKSSEPIDTKRITAEYICDIINVFIIPNFKSTNKKVSGETMIFISKVGDISLTAEMINENEMLLDVQVYGFETVFTY